MATYLVGISYHYPDDYDRWESGMVEDFEASTGLFVDASSEVEAIAWGKHVGQELLSHVNPDRDVNWDVLHIAWVEDSATESSWSHCLDFFPRVRYGEMPKLGMMTRSAYERWLQEHEA